MLAEPHLSIIESQTVYADRTSEDRNRSSVLEKIYHFTLDNTVDSLEEVEVPFPPMPVELVRDMVEFAALADMPTALSLALVSKVVNKWITPILYHTVVLGRREFARAFNQGIEAAQDDCHLGQPQCRESTREKFRHISTLAIHGTAMAHYDWTLTLCQDVQHLLLKPGYYRIALADKNVSLWPRPSHVVLLTFPPSWFAEILDCLVYTTHLYLDLDVYPEFVEKCACLPLTHICIALWADGGEEEIFVRASVELLLAMPSMKIVLIHAFISGSPIEDFFGGVWLGLADIVDERLIVAPGLRDDDLLGLFKSGGTVWDTVEEWKDWRQLVRMDENL